MYQLIWFIDEQQLESAAKEKQAQGIPNDVYLSFLSSYKLLRPSGTTLIPKYWFQHPQSIVLLKDSKNIEKSLHTKSTLNAWEIWPLRQDCIKDQHAKNRGELLQRQTHLRGSDRKSAVVWWVHISNCSGKSWSLCPLENKFTFDTASFLDSELEQMFGVSVTWLKGCLAAQ